MIKTLQQFKDLVLSGHKPVIGSAPASLVTACLMRDSKLPMDKYTWQDLWTAYQYESEHTEQHV